jgi:hypothetical protein
MTSGTSVLPVHYAVLLARHNQHRTKTLLVLPFVTPIKRGGVEIPDIQPQEVYYDAYLRFKGNSMAEFQDSMHFKKIHVEKLKKKLQEIEAAQRRTAGRTTAEEDLAVEGETAEDALENEYDKAYAKWTKELKSLQDNSYSTRNKGQANN